MGIILNYNTYITCHLIIQMLISTKVNVLYKFEISIVIYIYIYIYNIYYMYCKIVVQ